eukprot:gnl/MRDRNA2_/MRDRNA2_32972_c0_seq1.p1 gnl/MRDRNA2_/MRDRNA2_32972_c0~~gnl/MRDRNA2_/MRDRNA2_32972_c0_seq1.p1  ORF type:complete len:147 (+),score=19.02 gnl/MRDRNA2_/MRDRNA2_32972_c0_seq1:252-692(+)
MTLSPYVYMQNGKVSCHEEASPCILEQLGQCVIDISHDQTKYIPWLICMDTKGASIAEARTCAQASGIDYDAVRDCQRVNGTKILKKLVKQDLDPRIDGPPGILVNGKNVGDASGGPTYTNVKEAICKADRSLKGCQNAHLESILV